MKLLVFISYELFRNESAIGTGDATAVFEMLQPSDFDRCLNDLRSGVVKSYASSGVSGITITHMHTVKWEQGNAN